MGSNPRPADSETILPVPRRRLANLSFVRTVGFTCTVGGTSASVSVFGSHADEQAHLAYRTANIGGTLVVGDDFIANVYDHYQEWAHRLGGTVR